jgi:hypothetical protein
MCLEKGMAEAFVAFAADDGSWKYQADRVNPVPTPPEEK